MSAQYLHTEAVLPTETQRHIARVAMAADVMGEPGPLSTGEALAAALVLNRADWLDRMDYTIPEALRRLGPEWVAEIPAVADWIRANRVAP